MRSRNVYLQLSLMLRDVDRELQTCLKDQKPGKWNALSARSAALSQAVALFKAIADASAESKAAREMLASSRVVAP